MQVRIWTRGGGPDGAGSAAILAAAVGYGLSTTLSVAVLRQIAPTDLLAVEQHRRFVFFAFANHNNALHRHTL